MYEDLFFRRDGLADRYHCAYRRVLPAADLIQGDRTVERLLFVLSDSHPGLPGVNALERSPSPEREKALNVLDLIESGAWVHRGSKHEAPVSFE